ncbi:MAG: protein kinase [Candidatus Wallbacteria bacterium]|nr:protein kinase [Candidatus Wallbacteria bacterium]
MLGKYRLTSKLGEGGMASVYRGASTAAGSEAVAVKVLELSGALQETAKQRFVREIFTLTTLSHPNIVPVIDYGEQQGRLFYVMPLLSGGTLESRLQNRRVLAQAEVARLGEDLLEAIRYLHSMGFLHRDIKPANIMFNREGSAVLMDFGLVRPEKGSNLTRTGRVIGTPRYMPPEVLRSGDVDETSDLYQVGIVAYQSATGSLPYDDDALLGMLELTAKPIASAVPSASNRELSEPFSNFLLNAVEWRREARYPDAAAMLEDLGRARAGTPVSRRKLAGVASRSVRVLKPGAIAGRYELAQGARLAPGVEYFEGKDVGGREVLLRPLPPLAGSEGQALKVLAPLAGVKHPVLLRLRDLAVHGSQPFLVYDKPAGFKFLEPPTGHDTRPLEQAARTALELLSGLEGLHLRGVVHGEITLQNVLANANGAVRLLGLGTHQLRAAGLLTRPPGDSTARISTWMAPEQHEGQPAAPASDVYAVGRLLSLLLHGRLLPAAPAPVVDDAGDALTRVLAKATAWSAEERYPTAAAFGAGLRRVLPGARASGSRIRRAGRAVRRTVSTLAVRLAPAEDRRWVRAAGATLLALLALLAALGLWWILR